MSAKHENELGGEKWRVITPILLMFLSVLMTVNMGMLKDIKFSVRNNTEELLNHITKPTIHSALRISMEKDVNSLMKEQSRILERLDKINGLGH